MTKALKNVDSEVDQDFLDEVANDVAAANKITEHLFGDTTTVALVEKVYDYLSLYDDDAEQLVEHLQAAAETAMQKMGPARGATPEAVIFVFERQYADLLEDDGTE